MTRRPHNFLPVLCAVAAVLLLGACGPVLRPAGPVVAAPVLTETALRTRDGADLPVRRWLPAGAPRAVIVGVHGFNDYSNAFAKPAAFWAERGIATYAYDQRGFGAAPDVGYWAGQRTMVADLKSMVAEIRRTHPGLPLYVVGVSMGGAVALLANTEPDPPRVDGWVLVGPAVWGRRHMSAVERGALWFFARIAPWFPLTGEGLNIQASDNIPMLRALGRDPLVRKQARIDTVSGLVDMMDTAWLAGPALHPKTLLLYGTRDEVVPAAPVFDMLNRLPGTPGVRVALYNGGYHMLLRDLDAAAVLGDIAAWIADQNAKLPSGADAAAKAKLGTGRMDAIRAGGTAD